MKFGGYKMSNSALAFREPDPGLSQPPGHGVRLSDARNPAASQVKFDRFWSHFTGPTDNRWEIDIFHRLRELSVLEENWDSYGARPLRAEAAIFAMLVLGNAMRPTTPCPQLVPLPDGGVQLEWHEKGIDLELSISAPYRCELWSKIDGVEKTVLLIADFTPFERALDELARR
jgi:hypothetical protein